eukprot:g31161.t1
MVDVLLQCPYFRPPEINLWRFARRWFVEGSGVAAEDGSFDQVTANKEDVDATFSKGLIWELLPPKEELARR